MSDAAVAVLAPVQPHAALPQGQIDLCLAQQGAVTRPYRSLAVPPLQLSRVRYDDPDHPGRAIFTMLQLGGVLAGDRSAIRVEVAEGAAATVRGAAATQVLSMPTGEACLSLDLCLGAGGRLLWLPEPLILCAGARYRQTTRIQLGPGALLALLDVFVPGRLARGEYFRFSRFESRLEVVSPTGTCLVAERALIEPTRTNPLAPGMFGPPVLLTGRSFRVLDEGRTTDDDGRNGSSFVLRPSSTPATDVRNTVLVLGSLYILGDYLDAEALCERAAEQCGPNGGAAVLPNASGLLVRMLGATPSGVRAALLAIWTMLAAHLDPPLSHDA